MASGDPDRIEIALAEAALESGLWIRVPNLTEIGSFGTLPPFWDVQSIYLRGGVARSARADGWSSFGGGARRRAAQCNRKSARLRDHAIWHASVDSVTQQENRATNVRP